MYNPFSDLIYTKHNSLSKEICSDIIDLFELQEQGKRPGLQGMGNVDRNIKYTTDYTITDGGPEWTDINTLLKKELGNNLEKYLTNFRSSIKNPNYVLYNTNYLSLELMQAQKYNKGVGKYIMHDDFRCDWDCRKFRQLTFIWYLNDVCEGGETEFFSNYHIKPDTGKLVLFPAHWTFPHSGKMPISNDKYIITGWLYSHEKI